MRGGPKSASKTSNTSNTNKRKRKLKTLDDTVGEPQVKTRPAMREEGTIIEITPEPGRSSNLTPESKTTKYRLFQPKIDTKFCFLKNAGDTLLSRPTAVVGLQTPILPSRHEDRSKEEGTEGIVGQGGKVERQGSDSSIITLHGQASIVSRNLETPEKKPNELHFKAPLKAGEKD